jgi:hypothetical protein
MGYGNRSTGEPVSSSLFGRSASQRYEDGRSASGNFDQGQAGDQSQDEQMANGDKVVQRQAAKRESNVMVLTTCSE